MTTESRRLGLALSGGGYRASAFHLGTLKKLHELGVLSQVAVMSTISGGSITGAAWCVHTEDFDSFYHTLRQKIRTQSVIKQVLTSPTFIGAALFVVAFVGGAFALTFTPYAPWAFAVLALFVFLLYRYQYRIFPVSKVIEKAYDKFFFNGKTLGDLCEKPVLAIGSSNLHTGRPFTFSRDRMSDSAYAYKSKFNPPITFQSKSFPVSRAVMASCKRRLKLTTFRRSKLTTLRRSGLTISAGVN